MKIPYIDTMHVSLWHQSWSYANFRKHGAFKRSFCLSPEILSLYVMTLNL